MNVDQSLPGDPLVSGDTTITADLTSLLSANPGQTLRLRFAQVDNSNGPLQMGVDNVSLNAVPEPSTLIAATLAGLGNVGYGCRRRRTNV